MSTPNASLVKWVHRYGFWDSRLAREDPNGVPIITLDDLEAWLKEGFDGEGDPYLNLRDLLAQVQAMKEGKP